MSVIVDVKINGGTYYLGESPEEIFKALISIFDFTGKYQFSPLETLKGNFIEICEMAKENFIELKKSPLVTNPELTKEYRKWQMKMDRFIARFQSIQSVEEFHQKFFDMLLSFENLSPLHGFGAKNKWGDKLYGDPERKLLSKMGGKIE